MELLHVFKEIIFLNEEIMCLLKKENPNPNVLSYLFMYLFMLIIEKWISVQAYSIYLITHTAVGCCRQIIGFGLLTQE